MDEQNRLFLKDTICRFKDYMLSERSLSDNTVAAYHTDIRDFIEYLLEYVVIPQDSDMINLEMIDDYIIYLSTKELENSSIKRKISAICLYLKYLKIEKIIKNNPSKLLLRPKSSRPLPDYLTVEEIESLLSVFSSDCCYEIRDRALYELMYSCGLRVSEVSTLNIGDIYMEEKLIKVVGKGDKQRLIPLGAMAIVELNKYIEIARPQLLKKKKSFALFLNYRGDRLTRKGIWKNLKGALLKAGIVRNIKVHSLRHSFATHMVQNGADIRFVQTFLGHKSITTTEIYTHLDMTHIRSVYDKANIR